MSYDKIHFLYGPVQVNQIVPFNVQIVSLHLIAVALIGVFYYLSGYVKSKINDNGQGSSTKLRRYTIPHKKSMLKSRISPESSKEQPTAPVTTPSQVTNDKWIPFLFLFQNKLLMII